MLTEVSENVSDGEWKVVFGAEKSTSACVTLSVTLNSVAIFGVVLLLLAFATCEDPLVCLVISFYPPAVMLSDELHSEHNANPPSPFSLPLMYGKSCNHSA